MLLLCYEEFTVSLEDATSEVHARSLSSYNCAVNISVSIYDMSVIPEEQLYVTATGRIAIRPEAGANELPPLPPHDDKENNLENLSMVTEEEQEDDNDETASRDQEKEDSELQELSRIFGTKLPSPHEKQMRENQKMERAEVDELSVSLSLDDVIEQIRVQQETAQAEQQQCALRASQAAKAEKTARAATRALLPPAPVSTGTAQSDAAQASKKALVKKKRANLAAPRSYYKHEETGQVLKRPFLKKGAAEERWKHHVAHGKLLRAELGLAAGGGGASTSSR